MSKNGVRLTKRDMTTMQWIVQQRVARFDTVVKLLGRQPGKGSQPVAEAGKIADRNAKRIIKRWEDWELVETKKVFADEPKYIWLTSKGLWHFGDPNPRGFLPSLSELQHYHLINELRLKLEDRYGEGLNWKSERTLKREIAQLPGPEQKSLHIPDGTIQAEDQEVGIEIELSQKGRQRLMEITQKLRNQYQTVWYFVNDNTEKLITSIVGEDSDVFEVYRLEDVL